MKDEYRRAKEDELFFRDDSYSHRARVVADVVMTFSSLLLVVLGFVYIFHVTP